MRKMDVDGTQSKSSPDVVDNAEKHILPLSVGESSLELLGEATPASSMLKDVMYHLCVLHNMAFQV